VLHQTLACTLDLHSQVRQTAWNIKGKDAAVWQTLCTTMAGALDKGADAVAERIAVLGGAVMSTVRVVAAHSPLPEHAELSALEAHIARRTADSRTAGPHLRLERLREVYQLTPFEVDALLIGLAPDIALHYETLYACLQDDLTKKRPSVALVLRLLCPSPAAQLRARQCFLPSSPLRTHDLLHLVPDPA
jgi:DNA-binding ferritin-like protein